MKSGRWIRRASVSLMAGGLVVALLPQLATRASAADIGDNGAFDAQPSVGGTCGIDSFGQWTKFATGGTDGVFTKDATANVDATLNFEQANNQSRIRIGSLLVGGLPAYFSRVVVFNGGGNGRVFNFASPILNTGVDFLVPTGGGFNITQAFICGYPANASFTVKKVVTYPSGSTQDPNDPTAFDVSIVCVKPGGSFNWASLKSATLSNNGVTGNITAPATTVCSATDSSPLFTTTSSPVALTLDNIGNTIQPIVVTNTKTPTLRTLTVTKAVVGSVTGDPASYSFAVVCNPAAPAPSPATFNLSGGASQDVTVPANASCTVIESGAANFDIVVSGDDNDGAAIVMSSNKSVLFTNTRKTASLNIVKVQNGGSASDTFSFSATCAGVTKTAQRAGAGSVAITGLPTAVPCTVTETALADYVTTPALSQAITLGLVSESNVVTFTNTRRVGDLAIKKVQLGGSANDTFSFTYTCGKSEGVATLVGGQTSTVITGVITGTACSVSEVANANYVTVPSLTQSVTIAEGTNTVTFTNTRKTAGLTITKVRTGGSASDSFSFQYNCGGGLSGTVTITDSGSVNPLKVVPTGASCTVSEVEDLRYATAPALTQTVTMTAEGSVVSFVNTRLAGSITVTKIRSGGSATDSFVFTANCGSFGTDMATIIDAGTKTIIAGVPTGTSCTVSEAPNAKYVVTPGASQPVAVAAGVNAVTFTNTFIQADLGVDKSGPAAVLPGNEIVYSIVVTNHGPSVASAVVVDDAIPAGTTFVSAAVSSSVPANLVWTCTTPAVGASTGTVSCKIPSLAANATTTFSVHVKVPATTADAVVISNTATAASLTPEPTDDPHPNSDTVRTTVTKAPAADLSITKTLVGALTAGGQATYSLTVTNNGPSTATGIKVSDTAFAGLTITMASGDGWLCDSTTTSATCTTATSLPSGSSLPVIIVTATASAVGGASVENRASVESAVVDPDLTNNKAVSQGVITAVSPETVIPVIDGGVLPRTGAPTRLFVLIGLLMTLFGALMTASSTFARVRRI